jgi:ATP-dependent Clp protease ATP-binding subunit ClpA
MLGRSRTQELTSELSGRLVGQPDAVKAIVPFLAMYEAGLSPEGRPAGVFLLLGPTGTGKTKTVQALAETLHGSERSMLRVDCGEYQMDHEVAKLIGAPPGYLGHRETQPVLTQQKLNAAASERSSLALLLFDEVEKAAPSLTRLLLGVLDRGLLRLGDGNTVNFESAVIFFTSNLAAGEISRELSPGFGFEGCVPKTGGSARRIAAIGSHSARRAFPPEFMNRVDAVISYRPLGADSLAAILDLLLSDLQRHLERRLGKGHLRLEVPPESREFLLREGTSSLYGARELRRTVLRCLIQPLAELLTTQPVPAGSTVCAHLAAGGSGLELRPASRRRGVLAA